MDYAKGLAPIDSFKGNIPCENIIQMISHIVQRIKFRMTQNLKVVKATG